jgi:hypothetical protein
MVVVENPPTMDDEGKMARRSRSRGQRVARADQRTRCPQVSNMAVGVAQK